MTDNSQLARDLENMRRWAIVGLFLLVVVFVLFEALRGHHFWSKVKGEGNLWNYGSSLLLVLAGELAILNAVVAGYQRRLQGSRWLAPFATWMVTGAGFLFLACDEMLCIHEKIGAMLSGSGGSAEQADGMAFMGLAAVGITFGVLVLWQLLQGRVSRRYFAVALFSVLFVGLADAVPRELYINYMPFRETEELVELLASWAFSTAFLTSALAGISHVLQGGGSKATATAKTPIGGGQL